MRLTRTWQKVLYVVGYCFVFIGLGSGLRALGVDMADPVLSVVWLALTFGGIYYATRIFRGEGEPVAPARGRWRMTAKPRAGYVLGVLFALSAVYSVASYFLPLNNVSVTVVDTVAGALHDVLLAWLYFASSNRILRERVNPSGLERIA